MKKEDTEQKEDEADLEREKKLIEKLAGGKYTRS